MEKGGRERCFTTDDGSRYHLNVMEEESAYAAEYDLDIPTRAGNELECRKLVEKVTPGKVRSRQMVLGFQGLLYPF